ncbi:dephospho-CoA kinase [Mobilibacterium timonense]|uniref:dephospho-CoA kinase n=1 Tax=Mobilibacterium timonense TaxID=1871012 RepID=UPI000985F3EB|nr:dephospho-CoA kinase [Mobilibacterium timonense]
MKKIGITGGIGAGKTAVTDHLQERGYIVIDTDQMSRDMTAPGGKAIPYIREKFGDDLIDETGAMNRKKMRDIVFRDSKKLALLEQGTTMVLIEDLKKLSHELELKGNRVVFYAIPLLFEIGSSMEYDATWLVTADDETRIRRVMKRDGVDRENVIRIMKKQMPEEEKKKLASDVIVNDGDLESLRRQVDELLSKYGLSN